MDASTAPPPSIVNLTRLQRACFFVTGDIDGIRPRVSALPAGPWAGSLRHLGASYETLLKSSQTLAAAGQLEQLSVLEGGFKSHSSASKRFWRWCGSHPPLRRLHLEMADDHYLSPAFAAAVSGLQSARPALQVVYKLIDDSEDARRTTGWCKKADARFAGEWYTDI